MYNRYINSAGPQFFTAGQEDFEVGGGEQVYMNDMGGNQGGNDIFSRLGLKFDADTVFLLIIVYFLVADGEDDVWETLLIVAALLFLGY